MKSDGANHAFQLPPLILHPFSNPEESTLLDESSRASLVLQSANPETAGVQWDELDRKLLRGRYAELRMLFYIGKDLSRWAEQCAESARSCAAFSSRRIRPETFAVLLITNMPQHVRVKLEKWGVLDHCTLFRRSFGLHGVLREFPEAPGLSPDFLRRYHRYLDSWYEQRLRDWVFDLVDPKEVHFDLYASGEYSSILEKSWAEDVPDRL